jgi:hypothetical protein
VLTVHSLGLLYNAAPGEHDKQAVGNWAKGHYPTAWRELQGYGQSTHEDGYEVYNVRRELTA